MAGVSRRSSDYGRTGIAVSGFTTGRASVDVERRACAGYAQDGKMKAIAGVERDSYDGQVEVKEEICER